MILQLVLIAPQGLQDHMRRSIAHLPSRNLPVFNGDDGTFRIVGGQVMNHHLAVGTKLAGDPFGQFEEELQGRCFWHVDSLLSESAPERQAPPEEWAPKVTDSAADGKIYLYHFTTFQLRFNSFCRPKKFFVFLTKVLHTRANCGNIETTRD